MKKAKRVSSFAKMRSTTIEAAFGFMHNGVLSGLKTDDAISDSMAFAKAVLVPLKAMSDDFLCDKHALRIIENSTQESRFLLMSKTGLVRIFGNWVEDRGILYSNGNLKPRFSCKPMLLDNTVYDAWATFGGLDEDLARYGMFEACKGCPMLFECVEHLPVCTDEVQASEMVACYT